MGEQGAAARSRVDHGLASCSSLLPCTAMTSSALCIATASVGWEPGHAGCSQSITHGIRNLSTSMPSRSAEKVFLKGPRHGPGEEVRLAVKGGDQTVNALRLQDGSELGATGRHLTDCAVEIDVGDQPGLAIAVHHVVNLDRLTGGFDDLATHHDP